MKQTPYALARADKVCIQCLHRSIKTHEGGVVARREARLKTRIWDDQDFLDLPGPEQLAYLFLLSQPDISHNGVLPLRLKRWAKKLKYTTGQLEKILFGLEQARFVVRSEEHTSELQSRENLVCRLLLEKKKNKTR